LLPVIGERQSSRRIAAVSPRGNTLRFDQRLVLNQWLLGLFEAGSFDDLARMLDDPELEGFDDEGISRYHHALALRLFDRAELSRDALLAYDQNIVRHWRAITERRLRDGHKVLPKYFQYLALLFTEIYLDRYFSDTDGLLAELNRHVASFNAATPAADQVQPYKKDQLNKLAFWCATGSGKTLLMHVNVLQYRHYLTLAGRERELNRVILLTPNEGLSRQHLDEFRLSGMQADLFDKDAPSLFAGRAVEIIDIHKLAEEGKEKTVAVDAFEGDNLVLVDEGHRGSSGEDWKAKRDRLCEHGFSFEYSATFGQAMRAAKKPELEEEYAKCILFDYSYKYFYKDGYGKDYVILNLQDDHDEEVRQAYLTACLLAFYQQLRLYLDREPEYRPFLVERPLWVFVGGSVNAVRTRRGRQVSDVLDILLFVAEFLRERGVAVERIERLLGGRAGLLDGQGREIFGNSFAYLVSCGMSAGEVFDDLLRTVFNAPAPAGLHVVDLKGVEGEIALQVGDNDPFGVINVGDATSLRKLCEEHDELVVEERQLGSSLFRLINETESRVNLLIGSKKFTEGWNSWRVSTMGLMNVGRSEGSEIIQLFGRGVRLKGYDFSLKRSGRVAGVQAPLWLPSLETLNIFGVRADYMRQFKEYLEEEGLPANEDRVEVVLPVIRGLGEAKLRTVKLRDDVDFKRDGPKPTLGEVPDQLVRHPLVVDWYPKIQAQRSRGAGEGGGLATKHEGKLGVEQLAFLDWDAIFFALEQHKAERAWHNLNVSRAAARGLLERSDWYTLFLPEDQLAVGDFSRVRLWQELALTLLKKYCDRYYRYSKAAYEAEHLEYRELREDDPNFFDEYRVLVQRSQEQLLATLTELKRRIERGDLTELADLPFGGSAALFFNRHLYQPLLACSQNDVVEVRPVALNDGERDFVRDLHRLWERERAKGGGVFEGRALYLLRNQSRGRGVGFFEAGNFYPDFILWLVDGERQRIAFVDPKGLRNTEGPDDPKLRFAETIKELQARLGDSSVQLESFILSRTPLQQLAGWDGGMSVPDFEARHVVFQTPGEIEYVEKLVSLTLQG
jgi:hypothetical protein